MKRKMMLSMFVTLAGVAMLAGNAQAMPDPGTGYAWNNSDYYALTDFTTATVNTLVLNTNANWGSGFGIYNINPADPTSTINFNVFSPTAAVGTSAAINFSIEAGKWYAELNSDPSTKTEFNPNAFGFYFTVTTDDGTVYDWYTDTAFNNGDGEHIMVAYSADQLAAKIYLDDQPSSSADHDYDDRVVYGGDVQPVPEPGAILLFGTALAGLAGVGRKRLQG